ncbi:Polysialic acid transport protein KpsM [Dirofilaria immitis]
MYAMCGVQIGKDKCSFLCDTIEFRTLAIACCSHADLMQRIRSLVLRVFDIVPRCCAITTVSLFVISMNCINFDSMLLIAVAAAAAAAEEEAIHRLSSFPDSFCFPKFLQGKNRVGQIRLVNEPSAVLLILLSYFRYLLYEIYARKTIY